MGRKQRSSILKHNSPAEITGAAAYIDEVSSKIIENHMEKYLGKNEYVFHELISTLVHIDVFYFKPTEQRNYHVFVTQGMSNLPMNTPKAAESINYAELIICLPPEWKVSEEDFKDEKNYWPVRILKALARFPHEYNTWLANMHTVPNGNPPAPFAENAGFSGMLIIPPLNIEKGFHSLKVNAEKTINFYILVPLYKEEMDYKVEKGFEAFLDKMDEYDLSLVIDINRKNMCEGFTLEK